MISRLLGLRAAARLPASSASPILPLRKLASIKANSARSDHGAIETAFCASSRLRLRTSLVTIGPLEFTRTRERAAIASVCRGSYLSVCSRQFWPSGCACPLARDISAFKTHALPMNRLSTSAANRVFMTPFEAASFCDNEDDRAARICSPDRPDPDTSSRPELTITFLIASFTCHQMLLVWPSTLYRMRTVYAGNRIWETMTRYHWNEVPVC